MVVAVTEDSSPSAAESEARRNELAENLAAVQQRIALATSAAGRSEGSVELVAVTKKWPASDVRLLAELGVRHVGENRQQEAAAKYAEVGPSELVWHFIGQLQTNKAKHVARFADQVDTVDRPSLVTALAKGAAAADRGLGVLVQVSLDPNPDPGRGGAAPEAVLELADMVADTEGLELLGVMGVAPLDADPAPPFDLLAGIAHRVRAQHPAAVQLSAGMSHDLEAAIAAGATHVRVGTALLGSRPSLG